MIKNTKTIEVKSQEDTNEVGKKNDINIGVVALSFVVFIFALYLISEKKASKNSYHFGDSRDIKRGWANGKSRGIAIGLAIFLGGIGAHRFYLNKPWQGVISIIFCWTLIPALIALVEAIIWLFESDDSFKSTHPN